VITVGIIGPITPRGTGNHAVEYLTHVADGLHVAASLVHLGFAPYCPHLDFQYCLVNMNLSEGQLKAVSMEWISRCDVILALCGWSNSPGAKAEWELANKLGKPVVFNTAQLLDWSEKYDGTDGDGFNY